MKRLPIAKTEIQAIAEGDFLYVDKTRYIKELVDDGHVYYFLSRPRRFGKSLFVDTLRAAFSAEKEWFKGLFLENNWDWETKYPVISVSYGRMGIHSAEELKIVQLNLVNAFAEQFGVRTKGEFPYERFYNLIMAICEKTGFPVVILIDEYDKPILDNITKQNVAEIRDQLSSFYSVLKDASPYLKFVFLTGVSRFSKTSIFSKLNNITDISLVVKYADICGITQHDLETVFADYLHDVDLQLTKQWYDGYNFRGSNMYNPYDVLMFLWEKRYKPYWFETGTPTFLLELIKQNHYYLPDLNSVTISESKLSEFDVARIDLEVLLFQAGYLTIRSESRVGVKYRFELSIPNLEVKIAFHDYLLRMFFASAVTASEQTTMDDLIYLAISGNRPQDLQPAFSAFFAGIPHHWYRNNDIARYEGFFSSMFYAFFAAQGFNVIPEDTTNRGRIDLSVITEKGIFVFEFKMKTNPKNALEQIIQKNYHQKYLLPGKEVFLIGIEFDEEAKNISMFEWQKVGQ